MALSGSFSTSICSGHYVLRVDWSATQSVTNNTSAITVKAYLVNDWALNVGARYNNVLSVAGVSSTYTSSAIRTTGTHLLTTYASGAISHNADGTKSVAISVSYRFNATINDTYYGTMTASKTVTLDTIARASQPSLITYPENTQDVGYFGDTISVHMNSNSSSFTHKVRYAFGTLTGTCIDAETGSAATGVVNGFKWKIPTEFMNQIPSTESGSGTIYVDTYNGSTLIGTKYSGFTAKVPSSVAPSCTATLEDVTGIDDTYGSPVQGLSKIKVTVNPTLAYGSPIDSYTILIDGRGYSSSTVTTDYLVNKGTSPVNVIVTDKRGRSGSRKYNMNVQAYARPTVNSLKVHRCDADGTDNDKGEYVKISFSATVSPLSGNNATYLLYNKKTSATSWTLLTSDVNDKSTAELADVFSVTETDATYVYECDGASSWDFKVTAADDHYTGSRTTSVSTAFTLYNCHPSGTGIRFGGVAEDENLLRSSLDAQFDKSTLTLGDSITAGESITLGNQYVFSSPGVAGSAGYVRMARLTHKKANADTPFTFIFTRRLEATPMTVHVQFKSNSQTVDPALKGITYEGSNYGAFLVHAEESVWDLYVEKVSAYDTITLQHWFSSGTVWDRLTVEFPGDLVSEVPTGLNGYYRATPAALQSLMDFIFPVGFVLTMYNHTDPNDIYVGTTWERIENRFLWATTEGGTIGQTGGEQTHTLTVDEIPSHNHSLTRPQWKTFDGDSSISEQVGTNTNAFYGYTNSTTAAFKDTQNIGVTGGDKAHNNMPPYIQVSIWRRTA